MSIRTRFNPLGTIGRKSLLPAGYIELEYLESVGCRQYIDTGVVPQADCIIEADAMFVNPEALSTVYWCRESFGYAGYPSFACISANKPTGNMTLRVYHAMQGNSQTGRYPVQLLAGERFTFKAQYNAFYVNGQQTSLPAQDQYTPVTTIGLFWLREAGNWFQKSQPATSSSVRIYRFKVKSASGRLECNLIPALDPTGRPCMFDTVTQQPLYNEGTGEFKCGYKLPTGYTQVSAIYFNNATSATSMCYVDLGYILKDGGILRTTLSCPNIANRWQFSGYYKPGEAIQWGVSPIVSGQAPVSPYVAAHSDMLRGSVNDELPHTYVIDLKNLKIGIDSNSASLSGKVTPRPYNVYLGNRNGEEQYLLNAAANMTLYSFFYKDSSVKSVLVPCKDSSNNACLYDICRKVALYSSGNVPLQVVP